MCYIELTNEEIEEYVFVCLFVRDTTEHWPASVGWVFSGLPPLGIYRFRVAAICSCTEGKERRTTANLLSSLTMRPFVRGDSFNSGRFERVLAAEDRQRNRIQRVNKAIASRRWRLKSPKHTLRSAAHARDDDDDVSASRPARAGTLGGRRHRARDVAVDHAITSDESAETDDSFADSVSDEGSGSSRAGFSSSESADDGPSSKAAAPATATAASGSRQPEVSPPLQRALGVSQRRGWGRKTRAIGAVGRGVGGTAVAVRRRVRPRGRVHDGS